MADKKAKWTIDKLMRFLKVTKGTIIETFDLKKCTANADTFAKLYGYKQLLSDVKAGKGDTAGYTFPEQVKVMKAKFETFCRKDCSLSISESGRFTWTDPTKVVTRATKLEGLLETFDDKAEAVVEALTNAEMPKDFIEDQVKALRVNGMSRDEIVKAIADAKKE